MRRDLEHLGPDGSGATGPSVDRRSFVKTVGAVGAIGVVGSLGTTAAEPRAVANPAAPRLLQQARDCARVRRAIRASPCPSPSPCPRVFDS